MTGKTFTEFMDDLAYNPEMEFMFRGERYMISGYLTRDQYTLELCNIDTDSMLFTMTSAFRNECVSAFEKARVFDGQTISEAEHEIEVLYGCGDLGEQYRRSCRNVESFLQLLLCRDIRLEDDPTEVFICVI